MKFRDETLQLELVRWHGIACPFKGGVYLGRGLNSASRVRRDYAGFLDSGSYDSDALSYLLLATFL